MTKRILLLFLFCVTFIGNAQSYSEGKIDDLVSNYIKKLRSQKIDTICVYENYCVGCERTYNSSKIYDEETCYDELKNEPAYIFWKEKGKTFFTKINTCFEYPGIIISKDDFWDIYFSNKILIQKEVVKPFEYKISSNKNNETATLRSLHSTYQIFKMTNKDNTIIKNFDHFKLRKRMKHFQIKQ